MTRVLGLIDGKALQIDIETSNEEIFQAEMDQVVPDSVNAAEDGIGPYQLELKTATGSRKIKRVFDGGIDLGYMDLSFLKSLRVIIASPCFVMSTGTIKPGACWR